jgi:hypothetical protein
MKAIVIKPGDEKATLKELDEDGIKNELDGGWLEGLRFTDDSLAYVDEEGKQKGLPINYLATQLCETYKIGLNPSDVIVGTFIIVGTLNEQGEHDAENHDVPEMLVEQIVEPAEGGLYSSKE